MKSKWINSELLPYIEYDTNYINNEKIYNCFEDIVEYNSIEEEKDNYYTIIEELPKVKYWISYCIRYRPLWLSEWILQRGWRNDRWEWTEDWIFNDWHI